jgi:hypothetical protein
MAAAAAAALGSAGERSSSCSRRNVLEAGASGIGNFVCRVGDKVADETDLLPQDVIRRVVDLLLFRRAAFEIFAVGVLA